MSTQGWPASAAVIVAPGADSASAGAWPLSVGDRTETTINDTRDFAIGRRIENLEQLRKIGFAANRRLLDVQRIGHDCFIGEASFQDMQRPITVNDQRAAALRFADPRVQALLHVLLLFLLVQGTFTSKDLREHLAPLLGKKPSQLTPGRITYDLRRLRLHGLTERISQHKNLIQLLHKAVDQDSRAADAAAAALE